MVDKTHQYRVRIVLSPDNQSWIIEKMANRLAGLLSDFGFAADVGNFPNETADLNHWMSYAFANVEHKTPTTMLITHLDDPYKVRLVRSELSSGVNVGICLSSSTVDFLVQNGVDKSSLAYVVPGHDFVAKPRRIVIGLTTRLYADGRKREFMLVEMAKKRRLDAFRFEIFGAGWEAVIPVLEAAGAEVAYWPGSSDYVADYQQIADHLPHFDYYLYLGRDEGSLGTLDALAAGVKTIVTPQGFHVDIPNGMTCPFWEQDELDAVFHDLSQAWRARPDGVADLTWSNYARDHATIWRAILSGHQEAIAEELASTRKSSARPTGVRFESRAQLLMRYLSPYRIRSAVSHIPLLKPLRNYILSRRRG